MTMDEKLEQFYHAAIESATSQNVQIIEEYQKSLRDIYEEHKNEAVRQAESLCRAESEKLLRGKNRELSAEAIKLKRKISEKSEELTEKLFKGISDRLTEYMSTPEYYKLLLKQIRESVEFAKGEAMTIYINPTDSNVKTSLEAETNTVLTVSTRNFLGGTRAVIHDKNILIDNSFITKLEEIKSTFSF
ncbi:MAG: V-type ATP synthase subunit E [Anaerocolumna sp.]